MEHKIEPVDEERWKVAQARENEDWVYTGVKGGLAEYEANRIGTSWLRHGANMGLTTGIELYGRNVIDIGGGHTSILLDLKGLENKTVVDPIKLNPEIAELYKRNNIAYIQETAEKFLEEYYWSRERYDVALIYNLLQHVQDPEFILRNVAKVAPVLYISEPMHVPCDIMHPHYLTEDWMISILSEISTECYFSNIQFDYNYFGGRFILK